MRPFFFLREALRALRRNAAPSLAAFATILITALVLGVFIPVVRAATAKTNEVRNKIELEVFINDDATRAEVRELGNMISDIRHVESIDYVSKAEALRILRQRLGDKSSITEDLPGNPLPRSYRIKLDDPQNADLVKSSLQPTGDQRRAALHQSRDPGDQGPRGRHAEDPVGHQHDKNPARFARRPAGARVCAACRQHDPAVHLRPPARGRGDAAGGRDELVHPLAVRDRGSAGRLLRRPGRGRAALAGEGDRGGSVVGSLRADRGSRDGRVRRCWWSCCWRRRPRSPRSARGSPCAGSCASKRQAAARSPSLRWRACIPSSAHRG